LEAKYKGSGDFFDFFSSLLAIEKKTFFKNFIFEFLYKI